MSTQELPELEARAKIIELGGAQLEVRVLQEVMTPDGRGLPVHAIALGKPDPEVAAVLLLGSEQDCLVDVRGTPGRGTACRWMTRTG